MTKAEKLAFAKEMLLIEREESAVTGSRLSIFPLMPRTLAPHAGQKEKVVAGVKESKRVRALKKAKS